MATMDILEDLLILDGLLREAGGEPLLDGKLAIASLNRGGLAGSAWELNDPITGPSAGRLPGMELDGAKLLLRIDETDPASLKTMLACARVPSRSRQRAALPMFLEPLPVTRTEKGYRRSEDRRGTGAAGRGGIRARRQQPLSLAETALLRGYRSGGAIHYVADPAAGRRIGG